MRCLSCKADAMAPDTSTYFAQLVNGYLIIEHVPCMRCSQCGEVVYSASVMERLDEIIENVQKIASKIFIMDYSDAA